jgi:hypothetical protein
VHQVLSSPGQPLDPSAREFMEPRFGQDFSQVRVHADSVAQESARAVNALAYTVGQDIVFAAGQYAPQTHSGQKLIAHELGHTIQQHDLPSGISGNLVLEDKHSPLEQDAAANASQIMSPAMTSRSSRLLSSKASLAMLAREPAPECKTKYTQATSFQQIIDLVRAAESKLTAAGISTPKDQIHALRGIYYGTTWSLDYTGTPGHPGEQSAVRNEGFQRFTRPSQDPTKTIPVNVQSILDCGLFEALKASQDMVDPDGRHVDFGHLIIGMDARFDPMLASNVQYPALGGITIDMGGTGTELVTWLGDLGGGAASLAIKRVTTPATNASASFVGSDYGGSINLEGDIAASVAATNSPTAVTAPTFAAGKKLSDALQDYMSPGAASSAWKARAHTFLAMQGGAFDPSGNLTNRAALITMFSGKIQTFACNYLASRVKDSHISANTGKAAADNVIPASEEVAETFVDALDDSQKTGNKVEAKRFPSPKPAKPGACGKQIMAAEIYNKANKARELLPW